MLTDTAVLSQSVCVGGGGGTCGLYLVKCWMSWMHYLWHFKDFVSKGVFPKELSSKFRVHTHAHTHTHTHACTLLNFLLFQYWMTNFTRLFSPRSTISSPIVFSSHQVTPFAVTEIQLCLCSFPQWFKLIHMWRRIGTGAPSYSFRSGCFWFFRMVLDDTRCVTAMTAIFLFAPASTLVQL